MSSLFPCAVCGAREERMHGVGTSEGMVTLCKPCYRLYEKGDRAGLIARVPTPVIDTNAQMAIWGEL